MYGNIAWARQLGTNVVSNQFLFGADELAYIATHYIYTDDSQVLTASAAPPISGTTRAFPPP